MKFIGTVTSLLPLPSDLHNFGIASLSGFFTSDDNFQHVAIETEDGHLHELYYTDPQHVHFRGPLLQIGANAGPHIGMAGSYSTDDGLRHVTVGDSDNGLYEVFWSAQVAPDLKLLATQFMLPDVAAIAGFFDLSVHSQDVIVAMKGEMFLMCLIVAGLCHREDRRQLIG